ncbi:UDP-glucose 4-epimerase [Clostridia bacterium]|nr:UDP-glucose 4-epimerase [Clostridia bacterium]
MTIFVTGGAGYIGSHTCVELLNAGYEVIAADNLANSSKTAISRVEEITGKSVTFYETDVRDKEKLGEIFNRHKIDGVIHFAGLKAVGESVAKPLEYYDNNLNATLSLCFAMREAGIKTLVFSSSATVYAGENEMPLKEESTVGDCSNPYGWTKYMGERILTDAANANTDWSVTLLRYFNPVGAHESGLIGEDPAGIPNNLMPFISQVAVGNLAELSVFGDDYPTPDGTGIRDYLHVVDLAKAHVTALKNTKQGVSVFNLGTGRGSSVFEVIDAFSSVNNVEVPRKIVSRRQGDLPASYADCEKAERILGWKAEKTLADMCADAWRWQTKNPNGYEN